jgi:lipid A 3-O-deacylase
LNSQFFAFLAAWREKDFFVFALVFFGLMGTGWAEDSDGLDRKETSWTLTVLFENDLFGNTDRYYTNGVKISWISPDLTHYKDSGKLPDWSLPLIHRLPFINEPGLQRNVSFSLGQKIFTPEDIKSKTLIKNDRPYAGWLYLGTAFHNKNVRRLDTIEVELGIIGPAALAEESQNTVHRYRGIGEAKGWNHQLKNEPGVAMILERKWRTFEAHHVSGLGADLITHGGGALGNVFTYLNAGFELRGGWHVPTDFGTSLIRPCGDANSPSDTSDPRLPPQKGFGFYLFGALTGRAVLRDIFLDGNTFKDSHSVSKEPFVGDLIIGASLILHRFKVSYAQISRSKEFKKQNSESSFGSISFSYSF